MERHRDVGMRKGQSHTDMWRIKMGKNQEEYLGSKGSQLPSHHLAQGSSTRKKSPVTLGCKTSGGWAVEETVGFSGVSS